MHSKEPKASLPGQSSNLPANETVVSIIHHSKSQTSKDDELIIVDENDASLGDYEIPGSYETIDPPSEKQGLEQLLTPWGMGALLIVILANLLLSWAQWSTEKQMANTSTNTQGGNSETSLAKPVNLTTKSSQKLTLDNLSVLSVPSPSAPKPANSPIKPPQIPKTSAPSAVAPKPASNLTNALLPPSLQPQLVQTYPVPQTPSPSLSQTLPVMPVTQPQPVTPSVQAKPVQPSPQTNNSNNSEKQAQLEQERILEQIYLREQKAEPLGFNHQTRAKLRSAGNQQAPTELIEQLQQLQQQKSDESNTTTPIQTNNPAQ